MASFIIRGGTVAMPVSHTAGLALSLHGRCGLIAPMKFPFQNVALIGKHKAPEIAGPLLSLALMALG